MIRSPGAQRKRPAQTAAPPAPALSRRRQTFLLARQQRCTRAEGACGFRFHRKSRLRLSSCSLNAFSTAAADIERRGHDCSPPPPSGGEGSNSRNNFFTHSTMVSSSPYRTRQWLSCDIFSPRHGAQAQDTEAPICRDDNSDGSGGRFTWKSTKGKFLRSRQSLHRARGNSSAFADRRRRNGCRFVVARASAYRAAPV